MEFIHYGSTSFNIHKYEEIKNIDGFVKPRGGLWASPINAENGWSDWCKREDFSDCNEDNSFRFKLSEDATVYIINSKKNAQAIPQCKPHKFAMPDWVYPDFERLKGMGYDAILFNLSNDWELYMTLYGWDCDSILILNENVITPIQ